MEPKKILITGASGTVGQEVLKQLVAKSGVQIFVFDIENRKSKQIRKLYNKSANFIFGDITKFNDVEKIPPNLDVVIHLAALIPPAADKHPELARKINVEGTHNLIEHIEKNSPNAFLIYSSSVSVYGDRVHNSDIYVSDDLKISEGDIYGQSKMDAEKIVQNSKLRWTIFRLAAIMKNHKISKLMFHMPLDTRLEICTPEDTGCAFVNAINHIDLLQGKVFNLGGGEACCISYREFLQRSFRIFGLGKLNFPRFTFAKRNFHCGFFADGYELENLLHFRNDTIDTYFKKTSKSTSIATKMLARIFRPAIKTFLLSKSEPYKAYLTKNKDLNSRFFDTTNG